MSKDTSLERSVFGPDFFYLLKLDPQFEEWRLLAADWWKAVAAEAGSIELRKSAMKFFFKEYIHGLKLPMQPRRFLSDEFCPPDLCTARDVQMSTTLLGRFNDVVFDFLDWALCGLNDTQLAGERLRNPYTRVRAIKPTQRNLPFDEGFKFALQIDSDLSQWVTIIAEYYELEKRVRPGKLSNARGAFRFFLEDYIHRMKLPTSPRDLLRCTFDTPPFHLARVGASRGAYFELINDFLSDFIDWTLRTKFASVEVYGDALHPKSLHNPFARLRTKNSGKKSDRELLYVLNIDPTLEAWRLLAVEWFHSNPHSLPLKLDTVGTFLTEYVVRNNWSRDPIFFLRRANSGSFEMQTSDGRGVPDPSESDSPTRSSSLTNTLHTFFQWILSEKLTLEDDDGNRVLPAEFHNPVRKQRTKSDYPFETVRSPLPYPYIRKCRSILNQGANFRDWHFAQNANDASGGGDWFIVESTLIDESDPDCVWRKRITTKHERAAYDRPEFVHELWSPVRAVVLYMELEIPLRNFQIRMLDSGQFDTFRYTKDKWTLNADASALGSEKRPVQRGVFHRSSMTPAAGFFINTNKTADIDKPESAKGYVIPWTHQPVLDVLEKLRNWQEKYNPIQKATPWTELETYHLGLPVHQTLLKERGSCAFLFRDAKSSNLDWRDKPISKKNIDGLWFKVLEELERLCALTPFDDGPPICFTNRDGGNGLEFPLHSLRVSLITAFAMDGSVPFAILSKLIAGHARLIMTLYYAKFGKAYVTDVMDAATRKLIEGEPETLRRWLEEKRYEEIETLFAFSNPDAIRMAARSSSAAMVIEQKGICACAAGLCSTGGDVIKEYPSRPDKNIYGPVPGYPEKRNCVRCRYFLTRPAFLGGLVAHVNWLLYQLHECSTRYIGFQELVTTNEDLMYQAELKGTPFTGHQALQVANQQFEAEAERANALLLDLQATVRLTERCIQIAAEESRTGARLIANGTITDIKFALTETQSELYQLEIIAQNAVVYPEIDASKANLRRSQIFDRMLALNGKAPCLFKLSGDQQRVASSDLMSLLRDRTSSLQEAVEFAEGKRSLEELGLLPEAEAFVARALNGVKYQDLIPA